MVSCSGMGVLPNEQAYKNLKKPWVRVRVYQGKESVTLGGAASFSLQTWGANNEKASYFSATPLVVKAEGVWLGLFDEQGNILEKQLRKVVLAPKKQKHCLWINHQYFRGIFELHPDPADSFYVVNVLNLEDYLRGVLPPEIGERTPDEFEALKAQAVAARTYALSQQDKYAGKEYDLINDIRDQVYSGIKGERKLTDKAVLKTKGEVLTFKGELIQAYYHSTCAGMTDDINEIWEREPIPYLRGVNDDDFCRWSKFYEWSELYPADELLDRLRRYLSTNGGEPEKVGTKLQEVNIVERSSGGRIRTLQAVTDAGSILLHKDQIRWAFGRHNKPGILPSTNFSLHLQTNGDNSVDEVLVTGYGYGHGVGMCQCGAIGMARYGYNYRKILTHYYSGVRIEKLY